MVVKPGMISLLLNLQSTNFNLVVFFSILNVWVEIAEKSSGGPRSIAAFFSKRCLPPAGESVKPGETSPLPSLKSFSAAHDPQDSKSHDI